MKKVLAALLALALIAPIATPVAYAACEVVNDQLVCDNIDTGLTGDNRDFRGGGTGGTSGTGGSGTTGADANGFGPAVTGTNPAGFGQIFTPSEHQSELTDAGQMVGCQSEGEFGGAVANALGVALQQAVTGALLGRAQGFLNEIAQNAGPFAPLVNAVGGIVLNRAATALNNLVAQGVGEITGQVSGQIGEALSGLGQAAGLEHLAATIPLDSFTGLAGAGAVAVPTNEVGPVNPNTASIEKVTKINREHLNQLEQTEKVLAYKECVSDPLVAKIKNALLAFITRSTIDWINGGFDGGTAFIQNLRAFLYTGINAVAEDVIENQTAGLCSPYRQDVQRMVLTQYQYSENYGRRSQCGVTTAEAQRIATGEFGRQDFYTTMFTLNNDPMGAFYLTDDQVRTQGGEHALTQIIETSFNDGFKSIQKCADGSQAVSGICEDGSAPQTTLPGHLIKESLVNKLNLADEQLLNADEIGEIIDALMQSLSQVAFSSVDGLLALSNNSGNQGSYLDQVVASNVGTTGEVVQDVLASDLEGALQTELEYHEILNLAMADLNAARTTYTSVIACYQPLTTTGRAHVTPQIARDVVTQASSTISLAILPQLSTFAQSQQDSETAIVALEGLIQESRTALNVADINEVTAAFNALRSSGMLHNATDLQYLASGIEAGAQALEILLRDANIKLAACRAL